MNAIEYRALRETVGSQAKVAEALGLNKATIQRREAGAFKIIREAEIAIQALVDSGARLVGKMGRPYPKKD